MRHEADTAVFDCAHDHRHRLVFHAGRRIAGLLAALWKGLLELDELENFVTVLDHQLVADPLERCSRKILEAVDLVKIDRQPLVVLAVEAHQPLGLRSCFDGAGDLGGSGVGAGLGDHSGDEPEAKDIENQRDLAVTEDRGSGKRETRQQPSKGLDNDLLGILDAGHHQAELTVISLEHDDVCFGVRADVLSDTELVVEENQRQQLAAKAVDGDASEILDLCLIPVSFKPDELHDAGLRDRDPVMISAHQEYRDDGEGERDLDPKSR